MNDHVDDIDLLFDIIDGPDVQPLSYEEREMLAVAVLEDDPVPLSPRAKLAFSALTAAITRLGESGGQQSLRHWRQAAADEVSQSRTWDPETATTDELEREIARRRMLRDHER